MSYSRPSVQPGRGLTRTPALPDSSAVGVFDYSLETDIATTTSLGVVQVGSGLSITPAGILSATSGSSLLNVFLVGADYTATIDNYYIGATKKNITITFPLGVVGKVFVVKNQAGEGSIKVQGSGGQKLDNSNSKTLGEDASLIAIFDGSRWNLV